VRGSKLGRPAPNGSPGDPRYRRRHRTAGLSALPLKPDRDTPSRRTALFRLASTKFADPV
jgi:hypothetical protein